MNNLLYNALMLGRNKEVENEEFLVAGGIKEPAAFKVLEEKIDVQEVINDTPFTLHIEIVKEGYLEIDIFCPDDIIAVEKRVITTADFEDGKCEYRVIFLSDKLHNGKNFSEMILRTSNQEIKIPISIDNKIRVFRGADTDKKIAAALTKNYLDLRMGKISREQWIRKDYALLDNITGGDSKSLFWMLYKAQIYLADERAEEAANILEYVEEQIPKLIEPDYELSCYYIYIKSLMTMTDEQTEAAIEKIRLVFMRVPRWKILWTLFYIDYRYQNDYERKLEEIEILFNNGCSSPEIYFEALDIYLSRPHMMKDITELSVQVLNFAVKYDYLNSALIDRLPELVLALNLNDYKDRNMDLTIKILKIFYKKDPNSNILKALCTLLIATENRKTENHEYFRRAVREAFIIPGLYNYYIYTIDKNKMEPIPSKIVDYFVENSETLYEFRSYFYANIIVNKYKDPDHYRNLINKIVTYTEEMLSVGRIDEFTGIICREILDNGLATGGIEKNLFFVLYARQIICHNPRMISVLVFHNELNLYQDVHLEDGKAFVHIYSKSAIVLFKDISGNIYHNVDYDAGELMDAGEYVDIFVKNAPINRYMLLEDTFPLLREYRDPVEILKFLAKQLKTGLLRSEYEQKLMNEIVMYFSRNRDQEVYDELLEFRKFNLDNETRARLIEIMIARTFYMQAYKEIEKAGYEYISPESISKLAHVLTGLSTYDTEDELLTELCVIAFTKTPFDKNVFDYLASFYNDSVELLVELFRAAKAYGEDYEIIAERVLKRAVETGEDPDGTYYVFENYYNDGQNEQVKDAYLSMRAEKYIFENNTRDKTFFKFIESGFVREHYYGDKVYVSYLYYILDIDYPQKGQLKAAEKILKNLCRRGIMLERFKEFEKYFELPSRLQNTAITSAFVTDHTQKPVITYKFNHEDSVRKTEEMPRIFEGAFAKYFTLFEGEILTYKINNGEERQITYEELNLVPDESRYAKLDNIVALCKNNDSDALKEAAKDYYMKDQLVKRFFNV